MQPGVTVNERYEILSEVGRGGMGVVFRARSIALQRDVAIKIFASQFNQERAQREAKALAGVAHPNLVMVHSLETNADGKLMLVFDYIEGQPLSALLENGPLDLDTASNLFDQLCSGLRALHESGFVHRDIKPSNLMIEDTADGGKHLTVIDFGLAKSIEPAAQKLTSTGAIMGTPKYMSPEQFATAQVTPQSDLYSAACVLFEMLSGKAPYDDTSPYMVANSHVVGTIPELPATVQNAASLNGFFQTALAKESYNRFTSAAEMLQAFLAAKGGEFGSVKTAIKTRKKKRKIKQYSLFAAIAIAAFVGTLAGLYHLQTGSERTGATDAVASTEMHTIWIESWSDNRQFREARRRMKNLVARLEKMGNGGIETAKVYKFYNMLLLHDEEIPKDENTALDAILKGNAIIEKLGGTVDKAQFRLELGRTYFYLFDWKAAVKCMREVCALYGRQPGNVNIENGQLMARALQMDGQFEEVIDQFKQVGAADFALGTRSDQNCVRRDLAAAYDWLGEPQQAITVINLNHCSANDPSGKAWDAKIKAESFAMAGAPAESKKWLETMLQINKERRNHGFAIFEDGVTALNMAALHDTAGATRLIETVITRQLQPLDSVESREDAHAQIWASRMCMQAADRLHRPDLVERSRAALEGARMLMVRANLLDDGTFKLP